MYLLENEKGELKVANLKEMMQLVEAGYLPTGFTPEAIELYSNWIVSNGGSVDKFRELALKRRQGGSKKK